MYGKATDTQVNLGYMEGNAWHHYKEHAQNLSWAETKEHCGKQMNEFWTSEVGGLLASDEWRSKDWTVKQILKENSYFLTWQGLGSDIGVSRQGKEEELSSAERNSRTFWSILVSSHMSKWENTTVKWSQTLEGWGMRAREHRLNIPEGLGRRRKDLEDRIE